MLKSWTYLLLVFTTELQNSFFMADKYFLNWQCTFKIISPRLPHSPPRLKSRRLPRNISVFNYHKHRSRKAKSGPIRAVVSYGGVHFPPVVQPIQQIDREKRPSRATSRVLHTKSARPSRGKPSVSLNFQQEDPICELHLYVLIDFAIFSHFSSSSLNNSSLACQPAPYLSICQ